MTVRRTDRQTAFQLYIVDGLMAVLAYTSAFNALVWMSNRMCRLLKIYLAVPEDSAFILSKSGFNRCIHG